MKVAIAVGDGPPVRRRRPGHPAHRRARRPADGRARRRRAPRREGRDRARRRRRSPRSATASSSRELRRRRGDGAAVRRASRRSWPSKCPPPRGRAARRSPEDARPAVAPAGGLRADADRPRRVPGGAPAGDPGLPALRRASTTTTTTTRSRSSTTFVRAAQRDLDGVRRQRPAADARRQGRLPLRRLRVAAGPRGRRARAAAAALELRDLGQTTAARDIQIGITHGGSEAARTATRCAERSCASATG